MNITQEVQQDKWQAYAESHSQGSIFHTPYMFDVYRSLAGHIPFALFALDDSGQIQGLLTGFRQIIHGGLLKQLSTRAVLMQSPIVSSSEALDALLTSYAEMINGKAVYTEIRNHADTCMQRDIYHNQGFTLEDHLNIIVDLSLAETELWSQVHSKRRNEIRSAQKQGVEVRRLGEDSLPEAYAILQEVYSRARLPLSPFGFFVTAFKDANPAMGLRAYGAFHRQRLIGTMFTLEFKNTVIDLYAGSLAEFYSLHPNDIIPWEVFRICKENGFQVFDFGGAGVPGKPYGVRDYKKKFGGAMVNFGRYELIHSRLKYQLAEIGFKLAQKTGLYASKA